MRKFETPEINTIVFTVKDTVNASGDINEGYEPGEGGVGGGMGM